VATDRHPTTSAGQVEASQPPGDQPEGERLASHPVVGFIPWIVFWVVGGPSTWETGTLAALLAAILVTMLSIDYRPLVAWATAQPDRRRVGLRPELSRLKLLDIATVVFFAVLSLAAVVTTRHNVSELDKYSQAISSGALGLIALGSIVFRHPFTVDYAKEQAPPEVWHTEVFKRINLVLSSVWAAVFLACALLGLAAQQNVAKGLRDWLNWYIPIVLIFLAFRFTKSYPQQVRAQQAQGAREAARD
jgi:threonine/homoserine/homoserine lactone efflux protein